ncbi:hypothetical protein CAPTEDRAFT_210798 [Capitella teleta]|uniref:Protein sleepless n=1 Tax=Capitella teleta TaxID=283909 RepID=R7U1I8_CAPTE|nr:hypothetical protein CAPTEDRAFT_210798 [Capitella teleta]|eukprot:ELT99814.1 hypothetical protein CAPTEDRAFT_210798 [Capitella teleta]
MRATILSVVLLCVAAHVSSEDYRCYACIYSYHPEGDDSCVTDPANDIHGSIVECGHEDYVCRVQRMWDIGEGVMRSFYRGCEPRNAREDNCEEDTHWETCETFCETDLCNDGDGIPAV